MRLLVVPNRIPKQSGFTLIELLVVTIIIGISAAIATPSLINSQRKDKANEVFTKIRSALVEAQTTSNRTSNSCTVNITTTTITGTPVGCVSESVTFDSNIVSVTPSAVSIAYNFEGKVLDPITLLPTITVDQIIQIAPKDFSGNAITTNAKCIVVAPNLGMIRTGIVNGTNCTNNENLRYIP